MCPCGCRKGSGVDSCQARRYRKPRSPWCVPATLTLKCQGPCCRGTSGAHHPAICPEPTRTAEISAAGQSAYQIHPPWSPRRLHKTRPTGRLARSSSLGAGHALLTGIGSQFSRSPSHHSHDLSWVDHDLPSLALKMYQAVRADLQAGQLAVVAWCHCSGSVLLPDLAYRSIHTSTVSQQTTWEPPAGCGLIARKRVPGTQRATALLLRQLDDLVHAHQRVRHASHVVGDKAHQHVGSPGQVVGHLKETPGRDHVVAA